MVRHSFNITRDPGRATGEMTHVFSPNRSHYSSPKEAAVGFKMPLRRPFATCASQCRCTAGLAHLLDSTTARGGPAPSVKISEERVSA